MSPFKATEESNLNYDLVHECMFGKLKYAVIVKQQKT